MVYYTLNTSETGLRTVGICLGAYLVLVHLAVMLRPTRVGEILRAFPRHKLAGQVLLVVAALWAWALFRGVQIGSFEIPRMDMGEFFGLRTMILYGVPIAAVLIIIYADEFLSVRALGCLMLLLAAVLLDAAFLRPHGSRLLISVFAYVVIIKAMFWVGMPYLFRDQVGWATANVLRMRVLAAGGFGYGVVVLVCAVLYW